MLTSSALVLFMTIPGLALFYAGMVRKKNVLATVMQSFAITALITVLWTVVGYSLAFTPGNGFIGGLSRVFLHGMNYIKGDKATTLTVSHLATTIPESVYFVYQMTFAIITPALICGAFADRMKFSAMLVFMALWSLIVYVPIAHMVWSRPAGCRQTACSTSRAARWCTSTPVSQA
jgi:Amt family ammonium transporter